MMKYINLPKNNLSNIMLTLYKECGDKNKSILDKLDEIITKRGFISGKNKNNEPIQLAQISEQEANWLKSQYENVI